MIVFEAQDINRGPGVDRHLDDVARFREQAVAPPLDRDMAGDRPLHARRKAFQKRPQIALRFAVPGRAQIELTRPGSQSLLPTDKSESMYSTR